ncbi:MAG: DUF4124 domain-containing protein [Xanthomonadaceae bacterium]|nr:DUF4124 domain-containing protein [Xanthomonadaceae bacterium]MDE3071797.1 DUF4124 domain-containing protein [Pseudomonadota bacterium]
MHRLPIALALLLLAPLAAAQSNGTQVYKWTDAGGTVHYAQAPPSPGTRYTEVKTTGSAEPLAAPPSHGDRGDGDHARPAPAAPMADTPANRGKLCASLKANLAALQGSGPVVMQQNGKSTALDAAQRQQQTSAAQAQYQQYCQGQ